MKDTLLEFYINKFYCADNPESIDIDFVAPILRRRLSLLDKAVFSVLNKIYSDDIQNIVFSSEYGEVERLIKIINQYTVDKEVSPGVFSASVHNYSVGFFLYNIKNPIPYMALSSIKNSISSGILASVVSNYDNVLFCYCDNIDDKIMSLGLNISKFPNASLNKYRIIMRDNEEKEDVYEDYIKLFNGEINLIKTPIYTIERADV